MTRFVLNAGKVKSRDEISCPAKQLNVVPKEILSVGGKTFRLKRNCLKNEAQRLAVGLKFASDFDDSSSFLTLF